MNCPSSCPSSDEGMTKLVTFETPDGRKVCRAHAPLRSACLRHGASMSQSCRVMQFVLGDGECRGSLGCERRGELERPSFALLPAASHVPALIDDSGPARPVFGTLAALTDDSASLHPVFAQFFHLTEAQKAMEADLFGPFAGLWRDSLFPPCSPASVCCCPCKAVPSGVRKQNDDRDFVRSVCCVALGNEAAAKGMSYMTQDKEELEWPYWTIIAENAGGLSLLRTPPSPCRPSHATTSCASV